MPLSKVISVIPTLFTSDGSIDYTNMYHHIKTQINNGIESIVILGTTSEAPTLSDIERIQVAEFVYANFHKELTIVTGLGGNNTLPMIKEIKELSPYCDYVMISQPSYNKPSQEGIYQHFKSLIESTDKNIIIYNIPSRCGVNIEPSTVNRICQISPRVVAIKEASGNLEQVMNIIELCPNIQLYSGDDALVLPIMSVGGVGVISVVSNVIPKLMVWIVNNWSNENKSLALEYFYKIKPLIKYCFVESNPCPIKYIISVINNKPELAHVRLPLVELGTESKTKYPVDIITGVKNIESKL
jgi:4-hydroxy-tetrahydrodipicolinate synthase